MIKLNMDSLWKIFTFNFHEGFVVCLFILLVDDLNMEMVLK